MSSLTPTAGSLLPNAKEKAGLRIDFYGARMLLDDDVVTDGKTEPGSFPGRLGRKNGLNS